ncbi:MAG: ChaN family lipoprotein [Phycisphaerales bacterium]|nr:ChaN family lipoprotein [Phycisphaerales bacterium]
MPDLRFIGPLLVLCLLGGCAASRYVPTVRAAGFATDDPILARPMFAGATGRPLAWPDVVDATDWAEVIVIGERHNDATGHTVQLRVVETVLDRHPGAAASMEMLERDEQHIVDDYLADFIPRDEFMHRVSETKWWTTARRYLDDEIDRDAFAAGMNNLGWFDWAGFYQPIVDAAKARHGRVIAANAPWQYMRLGRRWGYAKMARDLTPAQRRWYDTPGRLPRDGYGERFIDVMTDSTDPVERDRVWNTLRSQMIWDATMAASIVEALRDGAPRVVHLVGGFHSDWEGGTVLEIRRRRPSTRVLTISLVPTDATTFDPDDRGRADIVVYTGATPDDAADVEIAPDDTDDDAPDDAEPVEDTSGDGA